MSAIPSRYRTGDDDLDRKLIELLDAIPADAHRDLLFELLVTATGLATDGADRLDLKITNAALREMRDAFRVFTPYRHVPKVTIFGSARTLPDDPLYAQARDLAQAIAAHGWMVVTGAGPGIMAAGIEGAGPNNAFGVNIRLPFEQEATELIADDPKLVSMKYFFTRKLMLMKESDGFVVLPGGFGTLDEAFELLTLVQTGKAEPQPMVLLDHPGGTYWRGWEAFLSEEVIGRGYVSPEDCDLYRITDDVQVAAAEVVGFYRNYHSLRWVGDRLIIRLRAAPTRDELRELGERYRDICVSGRIEATAALPVEVRGHDHVDLPRIALRFDRFHYSRLRSLVDDLNRLASAPADLPAPEEASAAQRHPDAVE
jgi:uncharacterized protein (TIGR00730 family)